MGDQAAMGDQVQSGKRGRRSRSENEVLAGVRLRAHRWSPHRPVAAAWPQLPPPPAARWLARGDDI